MSKKEKLIARFLKQPNDFTWDEMRSLLNFFNFDHIEGSGSRNKFSHKDGHVLAFHRPHPGNIIKPYIMKMVLEKLKEMGELK